MFKNAKYDNQENTAISVLHDGVHLSITVDEKNRHYRELMDQKVPIADYVPPAPITSDVRREAQRRIMALLGARDSRHLEVLISNGSREAIRLLRKGSDNWTGDETVRAAKLEQVDKAIESIRAKSNMLEAMEEIPAGYADDKYWL